MLKGTRFYKKLSWSRQTRASVKVTKHGTVRYVRYGFLLVFYSNFVPKMHRFWDIRLQKMSWRWNPGQSDLKEGKKVKETYLYSAFIEVPYTQGAQVRITVLPANYTASTS